MNVNYPPDVATQVALQEIKSFLFAQTGAGTDLAETVIGVVGPGPQGMAIGGARITGSLVGSTLTASTTAFVTFTISKRTAGGAPVVIAQGTTNTTVNGGTGNWVAWVANVLPGIAGATVSPGDVITIATTHAAGGTLIPASVVEIFGTVN